MKNLVFIPIVILLVAGGCAGAAMAMGWKIHGRELAAAAIICAVSGELALMPAVILRRSDSATVSQAGLAGTVIHMFLSLVLAAVVWMRNLVERGPFLFLLLAFFWVSLIVMVLAMARLVRIATKKV